MPRALFKSINLPNRLGGWNGTRSSPSILSIWPLCKLRSVKLPTRRDVVSERWLAERLCICHKKSHKWVHSKGLDWAQCALSSSKVTMCNMKKWTIKVSEKDIFHLCYHLSTKCGCTHIKPTGNEKIRSKPPWRHLCSPFRALVCPSIFAKATSIIRNRWVSTCAARVPSDSPLSYLVLAAKHISAAFPIRCCSALLCWPCCTTGPGWSAPLVPKTDGDCERHTYFHHKELESGSMVPRWI